MVDLKFQCFKCNSVSAMNLTAESRDTVYRLHGDPTLPRDVTFYCDKCGAANVIALTMEMVAALLDRLSSDDPQIQRAINAAKGGDFGPAIDEARRRFGF